MKTLKHITLLFVALITISSCTTEEYYTQEYYNDIYEEHWFVDEFEVKGNHWKLVGNPDAEDSYYEYIFDGIPLEVSYYEGVVTAYIFFNYGSKDEIQTVLPYTEYKIATNANNEKVFYSIQYTYDVKSDGTIAFKAYVSDYYTGDFNPGTQNFRVAIVW